MTLQEAKERINELKPKIEYYTIKYYEDEQVISDFDFDTLMKELKQIEAEYPQLITTDSPTQKVGTSPIKIHFKVYKMFFLLKKSENLIQECKSWQKNIIYHWNML